MPIRRRGWLTREGWYYLAVLAFIIGGAVLRSVNLLVVLAGMMIAPLLFNWRLVMASLMGLTIERRLPRQALAGEPITVEIQVQNTRWWMSTWLLTVEDWIERQQTRASDEPRWPPKLRFRRRATRAEALIAHVAALGKTIGSYRLTLHRRGRYRFGPVRASTRFPLGLVRGQITLAQRDELVVLPRIGRLLPAWLTLVEAELVGEERRHPQRGVNEGDYYGLRPWQSGDSLRWIHWRTTAKLARPVVRQYERRRSRDMVLVIDPWLPDSPREEEEGKLELAISLAATIINEITNHGQARLVVVLGGRPSICHAGPASPLFCEELLFALAELGPQGSYNLGAALLEGLEAAPRGARLVVISSRPASEPSLADATAELPLSPEELVWVDAGSDQLATLFVLE
jgi:uncharacterized protein (DUF58 family)